MCGIFGFWGPRNRPWPTLEPWGVSLRHRGPDDAGSLLEHAGEIACGLGHTRLSIIDLSPRGHQPMVSADGRRVVVFNGEIYNFRALRAELSDLGHAFTSTSDTEVLLAAFAQWNEGALVRLRGMFAFAMWDRRTGTIFLARDRLGVKPLYVARTEDRGLLFASEVRTMLDSGLVGRRISPSALQSFLAFGSVYDPQTIVEGVEALPPGSWLEVSANGERRGMYYELPVAAPLSENSAEIRERLKDTLQHSVRLRLEADVPVGVFLSGGIDSAVVASLAAQATTAPLHTFTVTFDEAEWDEGAPARSLASTLGTTHHEARLVTSQIAEHIGDAVAALDQPSADGVNTYFVSQAARAAGLRVALSGIGGDELFAGYGTFRRFVHAWRAAPALTAMSPRLRGVAGRAARMPRIPVAGRKLLSLLGGGGDVSAYYTLFRGMFLPGQRQRLSRSCVHADLLGSELTRRIQSGLTNGVIDPVNAYGALELGHYIRNTLLRDTDVMSMAHSLEVREPLLDHELIELALRVPGALKFQGEGNKPLLTGAVPAVPMTARLSPKRGFTLPFDRWMRSSLRSWVEERLASVPACIDAREVQRLWDSYLHGRGEVTWSRIWSLAVLSDYCARHRLEA